MGLAPVVKPAQVHPTQALINMKLFKQRGSTKMIQNEPKQSSEAQDEGLEITVLFAKMLSCLNLVHGSQT